MLILDAVLLVFCVSFEMADELQLKLVFLFKKLDAIFKEIY